VDKLEQALAKMTEAKAALVSITTYVNAEMVLRETAPLVLLTRTLSQVTSVVEAHHDAILALIAHLSEGD
jgi:hypothetical protein